MEPLTKQDLDAQTCGVPGCEEKHDALWLHGACHPRGTLSAYYDSGILTLICAECGKVVTRVRVESLPNATERRSDTRRGEDMEQAHAEGWHTPPDGVPREGCPECERLGWRA